MHNQIRPLRRPHAVVRHTSAVNAGYGMQHGLRHAGSSWRPIQGTLQGNHPAKEKEEVTCTKAERDKDTHGPNREMGQNGRVTGDNSSAHETLWQPLCGVKTSGRGVHVPGWEPCDLQSRYLLPHAKPTNSTFTVGSVRHLAPYLVPNIPARERCDQNRPTEKKSPKEEVLAVKPSRHSSQHDCVQTRGDLHSSHKSAHRGEKS